MLVLQDVLLDKKVKLQVLYPEAELAPIVQLVPILQQTGGRFYTNANSAFVEDVTSCLKSQNINDHKMVCRSRPNYYDIMMRGIRNTDSSK